MSLLSGLIEKKDLRIYLDTRIKILETLREAPEAFQLKHRTKSLAIVRGRLNELRHLRVLLEQGTLKQTAKEQWRVTRQHQERKDHE